MTRTHLRRLVALAIPLLNHPATGQAPPAIASGARVRITALALGWDAKTGTLEAVRGDTRFVRTGGGLAF